MRIPVRLSGIAVACMCATNAVACGTDKLGTSRTIVVDPAKTTRVIGLERSFGLRNKEVVLTFDDGPSRGRTSAILKALKDECTKATFFSVGRMANAYPALVRKIVSQGHTLAHHTHRHSRLTSFSLGAAGKRIDRGIATVEKIAYGTSEARPRVPFFRYPYLASNKRLRKFVANKGLVAFGANIDSRDWELRSPGAVLKRIMRQLKRDKKGIILMHDIHSRTAKMLPRLLRALHKGGYRVVHLVPPSAPAIPRDPPVVVAMQTKDSDPILVAATAPRPPAMLTMVAGETDIRQIPGSQAEHRKPQAAADPKPAKKQVRNFVRVADRTVFTSGGWELRRSQWIIR